MRWRLTGTVTYTDGVRRVWQTVPSLTQLLVQVDAAYPISHPADGTAAGQGHYLNSPKSDHTPDKNGDVRAGDIGEVVEDDAFAVAEALRLSRDARIKYVIHEERMFSSYNHPNGAPYTWRSYSGPNPHPSHVHVSVYRINQTDNSTWDIGDEVITRQSKADDGLDTLAANFQELKDAGVFTTHTQAGGITFNDEFATFLLKFEAYIVRKYELGHTTSSGLTDDDVKAIINQSSVKAPV